MPEFVHHDLRLLNPSFESPLVDVLADLEHLRKPSLEGSTPTQVFYQLKSIFHLLESMGSARIEGNHTTLADYVESSAQGLQNTSDALREVANIERAMDYIEAQVALDMPISEHFIRELHALTVINLQREGDKTPGAYRTGAVFIAQSEHSPPEAILVAGYMAELAAFINKPDAPKYSLMKVALAHHRFGWIHPFGNGNGRVVRLLTYALLIKYGFKVSAGGRLLNPTAVFCNDRERYYSMLSRADAGDDAGLEAWCVYVLDGVKEEVAKVDKLTDFTYLQAFVLNPAIEWAYRRELITRVEMAVLKLTVKLGQVKSSDLAAALPNGLSAAQRTYQVKKLVDSGMLLPISENARQYTIGFRNNYLVRGVIKALIDQGFVPAPLIDP